MNQFIKVLFVVVKIFVLVKLFVLELGIFVGTFSNGSQWIYIALNVWLKKVSKREDSLCFH